MPDTLITSNDFYERLEVARTASAEEIKRAYQRKLRLYPPERAPEEFKLIREAFETLGNPETRQDYDNRPDPRAVDAFDRALQAMRADEYETAERLLKQVLLLDPDRGFVRNTLGLCYLYQGEFSRAAEQFEKLIGREDAPAAWFGNAAMAARQLKDFQKAETLYREAISRSDGDAAGYFAGLSDVYVDSGRYVAARQLLEKAIAADGKVDFDDLRYFTKLLELGVIERDLPAVQRGLARIQKIAEDDEQRRYLAWKMGVLSVQLVEVGAFEYALPIAELALSLQEHDNDYLGLVAVSRELAARRHDKALDVVRLHSSFAKDGWLSSLGPKVIEFCAKHRALNGLIPIDSTPPLWTLNGFGTTLYGEGDPDPNTGSVVKVLWIVGLFIPLVPITRYRVVPDGNKGYRFLGQLRLSGQLLWWRNLAVAVVILWVMGQILRSKDPGSERSTQSTYSPPRANDGAPVSGNPFDAVEVRTPGTDSRASEKARLEAERSAIKGLEGQIDAIDSRMKQLDGRMRAVESEVKENEAMPVDRSLYQSSLKRYNELVEEYNGELARRKSLYSEYERRLTAFNTAVDAYNARR
jgi:curved DNA-binding protein CbpA